MTVLTVLNSSGDVINIDGDGPGTSVEPFRLKSANSAAVLAALQAIQAATEALDSATLPTDAASAANQVAGNLTLVAVQAATEATATALANVATQTTLALIKEKTDNLDTALSGIKTGTDKIIAAPATAAKQPALGTAGTASTDVITVQGIASGTAQPVSNAGITSIDGKTPALGQAVAGASVPVVLPATQLTTLTPPAAITGFSTAAKQPALGTAGSASTDVITVQGIASGVAQPMSSTQLPAALTTGGNLKMAIAENTAAATVSTVLQTAAVANGNGSTASVDGYATALFAVSGITTATINFETSNNGGATWVPVLATQVGGVTIAATTTVDGYYRIAAAGLKLVQARISGYSAGTITVTLYVTTAATSNKVVDAILTAGELHVGEVAGSGKGVIVPLTVSTSPAYTAGDSIGGKITIANAVRVSGGVSILTCIHILDRANQKPTGTIQIYNADPTNATLTDNAATVNSTDDLKIVASIPVANSDYVTINSKAFAYLRNLAAEVQAASGTTLYASFTTTATPTFAATTDMQLIFDFVYVN